jgi:hypothetical protein
MLTNVRLNNLQRQINDLEGTVNNIIANGTATITADIDMNNNDLVDVKSIVFNDTISNATPALVSSNNVLLYNTNPILFSPLSANLDCNNKNLTNVGQISVGNSTMFNLDGDMAFTTSVALGNNSIVGVHQIQCSTIDLNNGNLTWDGTDLKIQDNTVVTSENIDGFIDTNVSFEKLTIATSSGTYTIGINSTGDLSLYTGSVIQNSDLVGEIAYINPVDGLTTDIINFTDATDSANHHLTLSNTAPYRLQIDDKQITISDDLDDYWSKNEDVHLQHDIYMNGRNIGNVGEIGIGLAANKVLTLDNDSDLTFDDNKVIS